MESLSTMFNIAANVGAYVGYVSAVAAPLIAGYLLWFKGPRQLKAENEVARVITARQWPNAFKKSKIVAKDGAKMYLNWGASKPSDIPLATFRVEVARKGKGFALTLADMVKAEVNSEFFVRVDTSSDESIIRALESLGGQIDEQKIADYCTPKFDAALRAAAAKMNIEEIQTGREQFRDNVKTALDSLKDDGLILVDVALRQLNQSPLVDFDANDAFDAQGLEKVTGIVERSKQAINDKRQSAETAILQRNQQEAIRRLTITEEEKKATLEQQERVQQMEAEQGKRVAEVTASNQKDSETAKINAERAVEEARIAKDQQLGVAEESKQQALAVARAGREKVAKEADIQTRIALSAKAQEEAGAQRAADEARAEAVAAAESVTTAKVVAEAEREKKTKIIAAETAAQEASASERIAAEARVYVAQQSKLEAQEQAEALLIESQAAKEAAQMAAEGAYAEIFQKAKAVADGKMVEAAAQNAVNDAINKLSPEAMAHLVEIARVQITPEAIRESMKAVEKIGNISVTSMDGVGGAFGGAAGAPAGGGDNNNPMAQMLNAIMAYRMVDPILSKVIDNVGGDVNIAKNLPGAIVNAPSAANNNAVNDNDTVGDDVAATARARKTPPTPKGPTVG